jgi:hypothetical protein
MFVLCLVFCLVFNAAAFSDSTPDCVVGSANVNEAHLSAERSTETGTLNKGQFKVFVNGKPLPDTPTGKKVNTFKRGVNNTISVSSTSGQQFRGCLAILSSKSAPTKSTKSNLLARGTYKPATGCEGLPQSGVSHSSASLKTDFPMTLFADKAGESYLFDINVVVVNNATKSIFYYEQFELEAVDDPPCTLRRALTEHCRWRPFRGIRERLAD